MRAERARPRRGGTLSAIVDPGVAAGLARLRGGGAGVPGACALVWVEGADAAGFLQGLLSNDVLALGTGASQRALLLDAKGRIQTDMRVVRDGPEAFTLVVAPEDGERLVEGLEHHHFSERLDVLGPEPAEVLTVAGVDAPPDAGADLVLPGEVPGTHDLIGGDARAMLAAAGLPEAPREALEILRVEAGVPRFGREYGRTSLVQEAGLERVAVSFEKGCYLGQETVARAQYRGHVNRGVRGLRSGSPMAPGSPVRVGGRDVGRVTSAVVSPDRGPLALAVLRREIADGDAVEVVGEDGERSAVVSPLPHR